MITVTFYKSTKKNLDNNKKEQAFRFKITGGNNEKLVGGSEAYANRMDAVATAKLITNYDARDDVEFKFDWGGNQNAEPEGDSSVRLP